MKKLTFNKSNHLKIKIMKNTNPIFEITYTKAIGGEGTIMVRAENAEQALKNAPYHCFTGSNFRNPVEIPGAKYISPKNQGFQGSARMR